jgi:hypothetical protein
VRIVLTTPLTQDSPIHEHLRSMAMEWK